MFQWQNHNCQPYLADHEKHRLHLDSYAMQLSVQKMLVILTKSESV